MKTIFIGGVGSHPRNMAEAVKVLEDFYGPIQAYSLRQALASRHLLAPSLDGTRVVTHSAGMLLVEDARPAEVIAIAPPVPMSLARLGWLFARKEAQLISSKRLSAERRAKIDQFYRWAMRENVRHPRRNLLMAPKISRFDACRAGRYLAANGSQVNLIFFVGDHLFRPPNQVTDSFNLRIITGLAGQHDEWLLDPQSVWAEITDNLAV